MAETIDLFNTMSEKKTQRLKDFVEQVLLQDIHGGILNKIEPSTSYAKRELYPYRMYASVLNDPRDMISLDRGFNKILNEEQYKVCMLFLSGISWNLFITGRAGTGKTMTLKYLLETFEKFYDTSEYYAEERQYYEMLKHDEIQTILNQLKEEKSDKRKNSLRTELELKQKEKFSNKKVAITGSMGVSACNVNGTTLHSLFGLFKSTELEIDDMVKKISLKKKTVLRNMEILIIEEISMISATLLDYVNELLQKIRLNTFPFGGVRVIVVGDLNQLGPIEEKKEGEEETREEEIVEQTFFKEQVLEELFESQRQEIYRYKRGIYCFESRVWEYAIGSNVGYLTRIMRVNRDEEKFLEFLEKLRTGKLTLDDKKWFFDKTILRDKDGKIKSMIESSDIKSFTTVLHVTNIEVANINYLKIINMGTKAKIYTALDDGNLRIKIESTFPSKLMVRIGAKVMLLYNIDIDKTLYNGSIGYVVGYDPETQLPQIYFPEDQTEVVTFPEPDEKNQYLGIEKAIKTLFGTKRDRIFTVYPRTWKSEVQTFKEFERYQVPLNLAWSITVHKSQGLTLTQIITDTLNMKQPGSMYTALTRVRSINDIRLFNKKISNYLRNNDENRDVIIDKWISPVVLEAILDFDEFCKTSSENNLLNLEI